jgi:hypothetical protein
MRRIPLNDNYLALKLEFHYFVPLGPHTWLAANLERKKQVRDFDTLVHDVE